MDRLGSNAWFGSMNLAMQKHFFIPLLIPHSGQKKWIEASLTVDRDLDEPLLVRGITGVLRDVTERINVHNSLIESEERLRLAVEAGKMAIWEVDLETGSCYQYPRVESSLWFSPGCQTHDERT